MRLPSTAIYLFALAIGCLLGTGLAAFGRDGPVIYAGTLGRSAIVVEFTGDPAAPSPALAGRYFYRSQGIDIPLQPGVVQTGRITLSEERPCDQQACPDGGPGPIGAAWTLSVGNDGETLEGTWTGPKIHPVKLRRVGARPPAPDMPPGPLGLFRFSEMLPFSPGAASLESSPYDVLRLDAPLAEGEPVSDGDAVWRMVGDPRTRFGYPRIVSLAGGSPVDRANAVLAARHKGWSLAGLTCMSLQFSGFSETGFPRGPGGDLGGIDDLWVEVAYLSPNLMNWTESGSLYCGGAHPDNGTRSFLMDVRRGELLSMSDIFLGWDDLTPAPAVVSLVRRLRPKPAGEVDREHEADCGTDDLIADHLAARFRRDAAGTRIVFGLQGLPHALTACADDLLDLPLAEVRPYMTPQGMALFPADPSRPD